MHTSKHAVIIVGGGPTGLMLGAELALANVDVTIIERRPDQGVAGSRAGGLHARTLEVLDQRGIVERFLAEGQKVQTAGFAGVTLDIGDFPTRHNYGLGLWQMHIERILADWVAELGVQVVRGVSVTGLEQYEERVEITLSDGQLLDARYVVGCDGGRSFVRKAAGIDFPGLEPTTSNLIAQVWMAEQPEWGTHRTALGLHSFGSLDYEIRDGKIIYKSGGPIGVLVTEASVGAAGEPTLADLSKALIAACGTDYGAHDPIWISRFTDATRQAATYRKGRVLVAGDAAHIHPPDGGQGLQTGIQDAVNLGWKLAEVVNGIAPESLLDSYQNERHAVGARVLRNTLAAVSLRRDDERTRALRETVAELLEGDEARRTLAANLTGLAIRYDFGEGHPLLGRRMPDLDIETESGPTRVYRLLHGARPVLLNFGAQGPIEVGPWAGRVAVVDARCDGEWLLPVLGKVLAPAAVLVRPDGYVAWVSDGSQAGLTEALGRWFGPASS